MPPDRPETSGFVPEGHDPFGQPETEKLHKVLARTGIASRRACEQMIEEGRVSVNGHTATVGARIDAAADAVEVDGVRIGVQPGRVYYLLNKPRGTISAASDPNGRQTVVDLVPDTPRVFPVGRLDADTEGLLVLTNDGDLTHGLTHPRFGVEKEYVVYVGSEVPPGAVRRLREGIELDDGLTAPAKVSQPSPGLLRIVIHEGRNRQVRRMCAAVGANVDRLIRVRIGPLQDRRLAPGEWRELLSDEVHALEQAVAAKRPRAKRGRRNR